MEKDRSTLLLKDFKKRATALKSWTRSATMKVKKVTSFELEIRQQEMADLEELYIEVMGWNPSEKLNLIENKNDLMSTWQSFLTAYLQGDLQEICQMANPDGLNKTQQFNIEVGLQTKMLNGMMRGLGINHSEDYGLSRIKLLQFEHAKFCIFREMMMTREKKLLKLKESLKATGQWSDHQDESLSSVVDFLCCINDSDTLYCVRLAVMYDDQCFFKGAEVQEEVMGSLLKSSITGHSDLRRYLRKSRKSIWAFLRPIPVVLHSAPT